jgi:hypothetical protein
MARNRFQAYGISARGEGGVGTISSCFYLLVKYAEVTPRSFVCPQDRGTREFKLSDEGAGNLELIDVWDFGNNPTEHCSYSYHMPFGLYALTTSSEPGMAVAADRNPYIASPMGEAKIPAAFNPDGAREEIRRTNAVQHNEEGQNVLFLDSHVAFERTPFCGINDDNIYTFWDGGDIRRGAPPVLGSQPMDRTDSLLVQEPHGARRRGGGAPPPKGRACFPAETPVWVNGALVPICEVSAGQTVRSPACETPGLWPDRVEKVQEHTGTFECRDIIMENGNRISVVGAHCFMLDSGKWIAAQNLTSGLTLRTLRGAVRIKSVTVRPEPYTGKVYNLKIGGSDAYAVGKDAVIVRDY